MRRHITYANIAATLALVLALGTGGAVAATKLLTGKSIRNGSLTGADLKKGSVGTDRLRPADVAQLAGKAGSAGPAGPKGDTGPAGPKGDVGPSGASAYAPPPSGTTIRGVSLIHAFATTGNTFLAHVSFPTLLAGEPALGIGRLSPSGASLAGKIADASEDAACTGNYDAPSAPPGEVCVYLHSAGASVQNGSVTIEALPSGAGSLTRRLGFQWRVGNDGAQPETVLMVAWAYTAP